MSKKSGSQRVADHKKRKEALGIVKVSCSVWVKKSKAKKARAAMKEAAEPFT